MKITVEKLKELNACIEGIEKYEELGREYELIDLIELMIEKKAHLDWANWLIVRCMNYNQCVSYAVYAAEQVIDIFEKKNTKDKRPRNAIIAAKRCIENPSNKNKQIAIVTTAAASATIATGASAYASAYAAAAAAAATTAATIAACASAYAAVAAAYTAAAAYTDAAIEIRIKILKYGIKLLNQGKVPA